MKTADLDFIKVTEVGGIVQFVTAVSHRKVFAIYRVSAWRQNRKQ